jgi:hypothetical protein
VAQALQQYGGTIEQSDGQYQQWFAQMKAESASMPIGNVLLGQYNSFNFARAFAEATEIRYSMFDAGLALQEGNEAQFQSIRDPATGQPFAVTQTAGGFQLNSSFKDYAGKPVTFTFGSAPSQ